MVKRPSLKRARPASTSENQATPFSSTAAEVLPISGSRIPSFDPNVRTRPASTRASALFAIPTQIAPSRSGRMYQALPGGRPSASVSETIAPSRIRCRPSPSVPTQRLPSRSSKIASVIPLPSGSAALSIRPRPIRCSPEAAPYQMLPSRSSASACGSPSCSPSAGVRTFVEPSGARRTRTPVVAAQSAPSFAAISTKTSALNGRPGIETGTKRRPSKRAGPSAVPAQIAPPASSATERTSAVGRPSFRVKVRNEPPSRLTSPAPSAVTIQSAPRRSSRRCDRRLLGNPCATPNRSNRPFSKWTSPPVSSETQRLPSRAAPSAITWLAFSASVFRLSKTVKLRPLNRTSPSCVPSQR